MTTNEQRNAVLAIANAMIETINEAGASGAPAGILYMACQHHGVAYDQFQALMSALVTTGKLAQRGHVYFKVAS